MSSESDVSMCPDFFRVSVVVVVVVGVVGVVVVVVVEKSSVTRPAVFTPLRDQLP